MDPKTKGSAESSTVETSPLDVVTDAIGPSDDASAPEKEIAESPDPAQSSSATDGETPSKETEERDLLSVVRDAVEVKDKPDKDGESKDAKPAGQDPKDGDASSASGKSEGQEKPADGEDADPTPEELATYKPKTRKQIEKLLAQRLELHDTLQEVQPQAEQYGKITSYMEANSLTANDVAQAFAITAMFKNDPEKCREELVKRLELLDGVIGNKLPDDLKKKVDDGLLDEDAALELSRTRAQAQREKVRREALEQGIEQDSTQRQADEVRTKVKQATTEWTRAKTESDPDFSRKAVLLDKYVRAMVSEKGRPKTPDDAIKMADEAYEQVNRDIGAFKPAQSPQPKRVVQSRHMSGNPRPTPSTPLDVVKQALGGA